MRRPLIAANWKMHLGPDDTREFVSRFVQLYQPRDDRTVVFFPPSVSLSAFARAAEHRRDLELGVQDVHQEVSGAHTGAISAPMAAQGGAAWGLAGHSERRAEFEAQSERKRQALRRAQEAAGTEENIHERCQKAKNAEFDRVR